ERTKTAGALQPRLIATVDALLASGTKFRVLHMKHLEARVVEIDELQVVELLQNKMAGIVEHVAAGMLANTIEKHFEGSAIMEIFSRMNFVAEIDAGFVKCIENGEPPLGKFVESGFD